MVSDTSKILHLQKNADDNADVDSYIDLLFTSWYLLLERGNVIHEIEDDFLIKRINENTAKAISLFPNSAKLKFYLGWMINISPWYFNVQDDDFGNSNMLQAHEIEPNNPLYKWACRQILDIDKHTAEKLALEVSDSEFQNLDSLIQEYFKEMLGYKKT